MMKASMSKALIRSNFMQIFSLYSYLLRLIKTFSLKHTIHIVSDILCIYFTEEKSSAKLNNNLFLQHYKKAYGLATALYMSIVEDILNFYLSRT